MVRKIVLLLIMVIAVLNATAQDIDSTHTKYVGPVGLFKCESMPIFKGNILEFINKNINYPATALRDSLEGNVYVSFYVDTLGYTIEHKIVNAIRNDLDQEALRVTKLIKFEKPAMQNGKPVKVKYTLSVEFKLQKKAYR
jgi:TonB family protein